VLGDPGKGGRRVRYPAHCSEGAERRKMVEKKSKNIWGARKKTGPVRKKRLTVCSLHRKKEVRHAKMKWGKKRIFKLTRKEKKGICSRITCELNEKYRWRGGVFGGGGGGKGLGETTMRRVFLGKTKGNPPHLTTARGEGSPEWEMHAGGHL